MYSAFRPLLFRLDPERAHNLTIRLLQLAGALAPLRGLLRLAYRVQNRPVTAFGLQFRNPVGLAAGYDKDCLAWRGLAALGFGHIEVGTVTPRPQPGNPRPRVFRLAEDRAVINRMGFPGRGAGFAARRLRGRRPQGLVLGVNIGKNRHTPNDMAQDDYLQLYRVFAPLADYLAVNVSSPNTAGLRRLQARDALEALLGSIAAERKKRAHVPVLVKLAPDLEDADLDDALAAIMGAGMDGVIAANTTVARPGLRSPQAHESGGLSGAPLSARSLAILKRIVSRLDGRLPVIAVGGIMTAEDARRRLDAGAALVQVYTGLVYEGPGLVKQIAGGLR